MAACLSPSKLYMHERMAFSWSSTGALGSLWDRTAGLGETHLRAAAAGVMRRFPTAVGLYAPEVHATGESELSRADVAPRRAPTARRTGEDSHLPSLAPTRAPTARRTGEEV